MSSKGILVVLSGFSGSGKGTMVKRLLELYPDEYALSVSATTRCPRPGEEEGREYFFKSREEFEELIASGGLLEYAEYVGNFYGTPREYVSSQLEAGKSVILEIEIQGALAVREKFPDTLLIFTAPPSAKALMERLSGRGTESEEVILGRLKRAIKEAEGCGEYDFIIINDDLETAVNELNTVIQCGKDRAVHKAGFIEDIKRDLNEFLEGECL